MVVTLEQFVSTYGPLPDLPLGDGPAFTADVHLQVLLCLARGSKRILEFGTARGQTALALARHCPEATMTTLDVDERLVPDDAYQRCDLRPWAEIGAAFYGTPEAGRIVQVLADPAEPWGIKTVRPFDFAFVDSLHSFRGVVKDTCEALRLVRNGKIVWDDCMSAGVPLLLELLSGVVHVGGTRLAFMEVG